MVPPSRCVPGSELPDAQPRKENGLVAKEEELSQLLRGSQAFPGPLFTDGLLALGSLKKELDDLMHRTSKTPLQ